MNIEFNDLPWHDACLKNIFIDRKQPGDFDTIMLSVEWPELEWFSLKENNFSPSDNCFLTEKAPISTFEFFDCYFLNLHMNFGIIALESILYAECLTDSEELRLTYDKWMKMKIKIDNLKHYRINTNSTNSVIDIVCKGYNIKGSYK